MGSESEAFSGAAKCCRPGSESLVNSRSVLLFDVVKLLFLRFLKKAQATACALSKRNVRVKHHNSSPLLNRKQKGEAVGLSFKTHKVINAKMDRSIPITRIQAGPLRYTISS